MAYHLCRGNSSSYQCPLTLWLQNTPLLTYFPLQQALVSLPSVRLAAKATLLPCTELWRKISAEGNRFDTVFLKEQALCSRPKSVKKWVNRVHEKQFYKGKNFGGWEGYTEELLGMFSTIERYWRDGHISIRKQFWH